MNAGRTPSRTHRGAVLLLVLLVIVVLAPLLAGAAQRAVSLDADSKEMARALQERWAQITIADAMIALDPFGEHETEADRAQYRFSLMLDDVECTVLVSDEQAKANLNALLERTSVNRIQTELRDVTDEGRQMRIRPIPGRDVEQRLVTYAQIISDNDPELIFFGDGNVVLGDTVTLWGNGALNVNRATPESASLFLGDVLGSDAVRALLDASETGEEVSIQQALLESGADAETVQEAESLVTSDSRAIGVLVRTETHTRLPRYRWTVQWTESEAQDDEDGESSESETVDTGPHRRVILW